MNVHKMKFSNQPAGPSFGITFLGVLAVHLMEFDYSGEHYSYHGKKLENAVKRLSHPDGPNPAEGRQGAAELTQWGKACADWKENFQP